MMNQFDSRNNIVMLCIQGMGLEDSGNLTRSYRSQEPLKVVGEVTDRAKLMPEEILQWREKLAKNKGEIIN